ncbi:arf-GAP with dual PH domain-containing protein 1 isoform X2 [Polyodon spathula]|uniref:arf-GAP with dual PH domain-containing protein 1 isoform X2 n=1 Tax=Polyodon spathula TaxID=7913 RepID=UPI001B7EB83E|nr:arf-GAP with dual PH domain-containing protein 1 isoform X2 [Polyodon spathula]
MMSVNNERAVSVLKQIRQKPGNGVCADCKETDPSWASCSLGIFICLTCSGIHRNIPKLSKVKSLTLARWEDSEIEFMAENGNTAVCAKYEAEVPVYYYRPTQRDCQIVKEQWIRAKYEREEFIAGGGKSLPYEKGSREGLLWKRGRDNGQFLHRKFVLSERDGTLRYFHRLDAKEPKAIIKVDSLNATFQPSKIGNPNGLQLSYLKDYSTRNIFIYHENSKLIPKLTRSFLKEGYMEKTGPRHTEEFKKRWFSLDHRRLMYFKDPLDAFAKGEVFIGHRDMGYSVKAGLPAGTHCSGAWQHGITIVTPERSFLLTCETERDQQDWIGHFESLLQRTMSPQEYAMEALFKHKP